MQNISKVGGRRIGAGRPKGSGRYGEATVSVRVPLSLLDKIVMLIAMRGHKLPPYLESKPRKLRS